MQTHLFRVKLHRVKFELDRHPFFWLTQVIGARDRELAQGLRELGYTEGQNLAVDFRFADWQLDRLPALAAELVALKVDVIVAIAAAIQAAKAATTVSR